MKFTPTSRSVQTSFKPATISCVTHRKSLNDHHLVVYGNFIAIRDKHFFHHTIDRAADLILHLHGYQDTKRRTGFHFVACFHVHFQDHARHLCRDNLTAYRYRLDTQTDASSSVRNYLHLEIIAFVLDLIHVV